MNNISLNIVKNKQNFTTQYQGNIKNKTINYLGKC